MREDRHPQPLSPLCCFVLIGNRAPPAGITSSLVFVLLTWAIQTNSDNTTIKGVAIGPICTIVSGCGYVVRPQRHHSKGVSDQGGSEDMTRAGKRSCRNPPP